MLDQREQVLGDAIAAELGDDDPRPRVVAALLASVHRVLSTEATRRSLAGQPRAEICAWLAGAATAAFDLLEPVPGRLRSPPRLTRPVTPPGLPAVVQLTRPICLANSARPECGAAKHYGSRTPNRIQVEPAPRLTNVVHAVPHRHGQDAWKGTLVSTRYDGARHVGLRPRMADPQ